MYLGLVYTVAGFLGPLDVALDTFAKKISAPASEIATLRSALSVDGWLAWFVAIYAGPVALLLRSPFPRRTNIAVWVSGSADNAVLGQFAGGRCGSGRPGG